MTRQTVSIVIPTYNERGNLEKLVPEIFRSCKSLNADVEVVIVDDNSPDGTGKIAEQLGKKYKVKVIHRSGKLGLASAVIMGVSQAKSDIVGAMDADMSHPPQVLPEMLEPLLNGEAEVVVGSRYVKGGGVEVWPFHRKVISKVATIMAYPLTPVKDPMSGIFFLKKSVIDGVELNAKGYKIGLEILVKGKYSKVAEVPYLFRNRFVGKSKLTASEYVHYLRNLAVLGIHKLTHKTGRKQRTVRSAKNYHETYKELDPRIYYDALKTRNGMQNFWHRQKFSEVLGEARISPESVVADIGCGPGVLISQLPKNKLTVAVDVSEQTVKFATDLNKKMGRNVKGVVALAEKLPFKDNTFDCVFMIEVIEHMPRELEARALSEVKRVLKPGGQFIMTTPNYRSLWPIVEYFWSMLNPVDYMEQHINRKNPESARKSLEAAGFTVRTIRTFFFIAPFVAIFSQALAKKLFSLEKKLIPNIGLLVIAKAEKL
ncbi:glycosyltransferase [Candidatus Woesearchaeota archaeon]|nr:glycosyltransferase [Candidatus Woesearchaeota archaeon]